MGGGEGEGGRADRLSTWKFTSAARDQLHILILRRTVEENHHHHHRHNSLFYGIKYLKLLWLITKRYL